MSLFERRRNDAEGPLPRAVEEIESAVDLFPVRQVEEGVGNGFRVAAFQNVFGREDQGLHLEEIP